MNFVTISVKCTLPEPPVFLAKNSEGGLSLKKADNEIRLNALNTRGDDILLEIGSMVGNVIFIFDNEFQIDPLLEGDTERGVFEFKEPEQTTAVDVSKTFFEGEEVLSYYFDNIATARRFIDKKIFGELYFLKSVDDRLIFYPQFKEAFLFASNSVDVGFVGFLDCGNTLSAPSVKVTELGVEHTDKKTYKIKDTKACLELPVWRKYRLEFTPSSGMHIIRMSRGKVAVKDKNGNRYWRPQDEILKIHVCEG